jgi:hypothetical protein
MNLSMNSNQIFYDIAKGMVLWLSPIVLAVGVLLLSVGKGKYDVLGAIFDKERGIKVRVIPALERNIYSAHQWLVMINK